MAGCHDVQSHGLDLPEEFSFIRKISMEQHCTEFNIIILSFLSFFPENLIFKSLFPKDRGTKGISVSYLDGRSVSSEVKQSF